MSKQEFLSRLREGLKGVPQTDLDERLTFYSEMIDDRMEEGMSEEEAVSAIGPVEDVISQIISEIPLPRIVAERVKPKRQIRIWEVILLVLGSPIWLSLLLTFIVVLFSLYIAIWAVILSLWVVEASFAVCALAFVAGMFLFLFRGDFFSALAIFSGALVLAGLGIFLFFGCKACTRGALILTQKIALGVKTLFLGKENR